MPKILTIEDDPSTARAIIAELERRGCAVDWVTTAREGLLKAVGESYDAITLDRMLPDRDGLAVVTTMREVGVHTPVLMITSQAITLQGQPVMTVEQAEQTAGDVLPQLKSQLLLVPMAQMQGQAADALTRGEINIMADKDIPYSLLKKVMVTAGEAQFARIALSVDHRSSKAAAP